MMNLITTTELRTRTSELVNFLLAGESVNLIHRSKIIGEITPAKEKGKKFNAKEFQKIVDRLNLQRLSYKQRERNYRTHLLKKYGKGLS